MIRIIGVTITFLLSACSVTITGGELSRAEVMCKDRGGIDHFYAPTFFAIVDATKLYGVKCNNNEMIAVNRGKW